MSSVTKIKSTELYEIVSSQKEMYRVFLTNLGGQQINLHN
jgi:hypothetical protein